METLLPRARKSVATTWGRICLALGVAWAAVGCGAPEDRVASVFLAQSFINEQLKGTSKEGLVEKLKVVLDPERSEILLQGQVRIPVEELRAINLDPSLGLYRFQVALKPETTKAGHLILEFPLKQTFFYPANSKDPEEDRVIVPVQMLSVALASARGYLAALSGDFSGFDRRVQKYQSQIKRINRELSIEKNPAAIEELKTERESARLQLSAVPIERKQLQGISKQVEHILGFTGEKEINLNDEFAARKNALILKIKLSQLTPYLKGVELGGVRILHDKKDGGGENYLAVDLNSELSAPIPNTPAAPKTNNPGRKIAPSLVIRLNQSLFEAKALVDAEEKTLNSKVRNLDLQLKEDGLHVGGVYHGFWFLNFPFETVVDFVGIGTDLFEVRMRELNFAGIDLEFLENRILDTIKLRLDKTLKGICTFSHVKGTKAHPGALQVTVEPSKLVPAFPALHLVDVDVRDREFLLKIGQP